MVSKAKRIVRLMHDVAVIIMAAPLWLLVVWESRR